MDIEELSKYECTSYFQVCNVFLDQFLDISYDNFFYLIEDNELNLIPKNSIDESEEFYLKHDDENYGSCSFDFNKDEKLVNFRAIIVPVNDKQAATASSHFEFLLNSMYITAEASGGDVEVREVGKHYQLITNGLFITLTLGRNEAAGNPFVSLWCEHAPFEAAPKKPRSKITGKKNNLNLRKALYYSFDADYPISGGLGLTLQDPIIVNEAVHSFSVSIVRSVARDVSIYYGFWNAEISETALLKHKEQNIDRIEISFTDRNNINHKAYIYFDITLGFSNIMTKSNNVVIQAVSEINPQLKDIDYRLRPYFTGAASWALNSTERIDSEATMVMYTIDKEHANIIVSLLEECGLLIAKYRGAAFKHKASLK